MRRRGGDYMWFAAVSSKLEMRTLSMNYRTLIARLLVTFGLLCAACSSSADVTASGDTTGDTSSSSNTDDPDESSSGSSSDETNQSARDEADSADAASGSEQESDAEDQDEDHDRDDQSAVTQVGPMSAADAIEMFGTVDRPWLGPLTADGICEQLPQEHLRAVLGRPALFEVSSACGDDGSIKIRFETHLADVDPLAEGFVGDYRPVEDLGLDAGFRDGSSRRVVVITETHRWEISGPAGNITTAENLIDLTRIVVARFNPENRIVGAPDITGAELENLTAWMAEYRASQESTVPGETFETAVTGALRLSNSPRGDVVVVHDCYIGKTSPQGSPSYYPDTVLIDVSGPWRVVERVGFRVTNFAECVDGTTGFASDSPLSDPTGPGVAPARGNDARLVPDAGFEPPPEAPSQDLSRSELVQIFDDGTYPSEIIECWAGGLYDEFGADGVNEMGLTAGFFDLSAFSEDQHQRFIDISTDCQFFAATVFDSPPTLDQVACAQEALGADTLQAIGELVVELLTGATDDGSALDSEAEQAAAACQ